MTTKGDPGRPSWVPTPDQRQQVELMAGVGIAQDDIALVMGVSSPTLRKACRVELDRGSVKANAKVAANLYRMATGTGREAVVAAIFWLKTRCGWSEFSPTPESPRRLGKKERAQQESADAAKGTGWSGLVN